MVPGGRCAGRLLRAAGVLLLLVRPAAADGGDPALAARIFAGLAVRAQIEAIVPVASDQLSNAQGAPDPDRRVLDRIVAQGFAADRLARAAQHAFLEQLAPEDGLMRARVAAGWLARPSSRRLHAALVGPAPHTCAPIEPDSERLRLALAIERGVGGAERMHRHARVVVHHMSDAANALLPEWQRMASPRPWSLPPAEGAGDAAARACRFAALSTAELRAARRFVEGEVGRWLYDAVARSIDDALGAAARRTARALVRHFEGRGRAVPLRVADDRAGPRAPRAG